MTYSVAWKRVLVRACLAGVLLTAVSTGAANAAQDIALTLTPTSANMTVGSSQNIEVTLAFTDPPGLGTEATRVRFSLPPSLSVDGTPTLSSGTYDPVNRIWEVVAPTSNGTETLTLPVKAATSGPVGSATVEAVAWGSLLEANSDLANNAATATVTLDALQAELAMTASGPGTPPAVGASTTFTATIASTGPNTATGIVVNAPVPSGLKLTSAVATAGTYDADTGVWTLPTLATSSFATLTLNGTALAGGLVTFNAKRTGLDVGVTDTGGADTATASTTVPTPTPVTNTVTNTVTQTVTQPAPPPVTVTQTVPTTVTQVVPAPEKPHLEISELRLRTTASAKVIKTRKPKRVKVTIALSGKKSNLTREDCEKRKANLQVRFQRTKGAKDIPFTKFSKGACLWETTLTFKRYRGRLWYRGKVTIAKGKNGGTLTSRYFKGRSRL